MRKSSKFLIYALVFLLAINLTALLTLAYNRLFFQKSPSSESGKTAGSLQKELNLTPQQNERMKAHRKAYKKEIQPIVLEIQKKNKLLLDEIQSEKPSLKRIYALVDEISQLQAEIKKEAVKKLLQEKSILNSFQRKQYFSMFEQHVCGRGMGPHHHSGKSVAPEERKKKEIEKESCINQMVHQ